MGFSILVSYLGDVTSLCTTPVNISDVLNEPQKPTKCSKLNKLQVQVNSSAVLICNTIGSLCNTSG